MLARTETLSLTRTEGWGISTHSAGHLVVGQVSSSSGGAEAMEMLSATMASIRTTIPTTSFVRFSIDVIS